jgi:peroxiredoxin family protein
MTEPSADAHQKKMCVICWNADLVSMAIEFRAVTATASALEVDVFFTFRRLRVLQRNDKRPTGVNLKQKMESVFDRGGTDRLHLGKLHISGVGTMMIKQLANKCKVATPRDLLGMASDLAMRLRPRQMTMELYGWTKDNFIDGLQPPIRAASFIDMAADADITLFI